jgi:hypothetical protein
MSADRLYEGGLLSSSPRFLFENPLHDTGADTELPADLVDAIALSSERHDLSLDRGLSSAPA